MIEGAPGVGKAALLDHYEEQFRDYCRGRGAYYVIRYQPAPAVAWLLHTILRSLGHLEKIGRKLALCGAAKSGEVKECAQSPDVRIVLDILAHAAESDARLAKCARLARARERYFALLPELEGRLQDRIPLSPIMYPLEAHRLFEFYVSRARDAAQSNPMAAGEDQGGLRVVRSGRGEAHISALARPVRSRRNRGRHAAGLSA